MGALILFAAATAQAVRPAPSVPPSGATGHATVTITTAYEVGDGKPAPTISHSQRTALLAQADGSTRPAYLTEFE